MKDLKWKVGETGYFINWKNWKVHSNKIKTITHVLQNWNNKNMPLLHVCDTYTYEEKIKYTGAPFFKTEKATKNYMRIRAKIHIKEYNKETTKINSILKMFPELKELITRLE